MQALSSKNVVVIAGPSGSGKNAIISSILQRFHNCTIAVTATTRARRPGEEEGVDYYFLPIEQFDQARREGKIPEHRYVAGLDTHYGLYLPDLEKKLAAGKTVFAAVDIEGANYLKQHFNATTIFIMPESIGQFRSRLRTRNPEWSEKEFETRMKLSEEEMRMHAPHYDYRVVNADGSLPETVENVIGILRKEGYNLQ